MTMASWARPSQFWGREEREDFQRKEHIDKTMIHNQGLFQVVPWVDPQDYVSQSSNFIDEETKTNRGKKSLKFRGRSLYRESGS